VFILNVTCINSLKLFISLAQVLFKSASRVEYKISSCLNLCVTANDFNLNRLHVHEDSLASCLLADHLQILILTLLRLIILLNELVRYLN